MLMVIIMKLNTYLPLILCLTVGFFMGKLMFSQYDDKQGLKLVSSASEKVYFIQQGVYSSKESMEENTSNLTYYIYTIDNDRYYVYIGITKNEENLDKLKGYFDSLGYNIYVKEFYISSESFITVLDQYETMLSETNDSKTIGAICSQILSKYEELVINSEFKD